MRVEQRDGTIERKIVTGMIVDKEVLARIADKWTTKEGLFRSKWCNIVGSWCVKHFNRYAEAPAKAIEARFASWASNGADKESVTLVERFLESLSGEYEEHQKEINRDFLVDLAAEHFNGVRMEKLQVQMESLRLAGKTEEALKLVQGFTKLEMGSTGIIDPFSDMDSIREAFAEERESVIIYPGALKNFFGDNLERDGFIAFQAPDKTGKSFWLLDVAYRGVLQRKRVAFFEVGDMSKNQVMRRLARRAAGRPLNPCSIRYPKFLLHDPSEEYASVDFEEREFKKKLDWRTAWKAFQSIQQNKIRSDESYFKFSWHANSTINVYGIKAILERYVREGWIPDVVVIDYADILAPLPGSMEGRDKINDTWKALRALSQEFHCLVVTATQSNAKAYTANLINRTNFSDDKRKLAHVTGMIGINVSAEEKKQELARLNWIVLRDSEFNTDKCVHVAGCLALANPAVKSVF